LKYRLITYAYLLALLAGTVIPLSTGVALNDNYTMSIRWDYLLHALVYLPLPFLLALSLREGSRKTARQPGTVTQPPEPGSNAQQPGSGANYRQPGPTDTARQPGPTDTARPQNTHRFWVRVVLYSLLITALLECLQLVIPYRAFNINDLLANGVGAGIGLVLVLAFRNRVGGVQHAITR